ncbi:MAG: c-type cytochrome [Acidobacteriaceae bacterium]|nr:c-type cytochrome [Acidobacteriaceae bacterium]
MRFGTALALWALVLFLPGLSAAQAHQPTPAPRQQQAEDTAAVERGRALFKSTCGFCHGTDATGARAPDLVRSAITLHDDHGNLLGPVIRNGRQDKGMPSFSTLKDDQIADIVAFLHHQADAALHSAHVPGDYPLAKLLTGNAEAGRAFFYGAGNCSQCHSATGDLAGIAKKFSPIDLQQQMVYPSGKKVSEATARTATVTLPNGTKYEGKLALYDEFNIGIMCQDGWYRSWPLTDVQVEVHDPLTAHRELMDKYTDADVHNLFAFLERLK